jgi:Gpi18-like mannosyltransferase
LPTLERRVCCAAVYELQGEGRDGKQHFFTKPWAMTTVMFLGMSFCLPFAYWEEYKAKQAAKKQLQEFANGNAVEEPLLDSTILVSWFINNHWCNTYAMLSAVLCITFHKRA